ncbi:exodeoxyribonuclease VII large subunit [Pontiella agarivorans]|uniref:Exodeoxyribonuclease 7 large subunit n=1 Tax=Pontiella agarivorans TaxID=3038953 RepID=A0ABU5MW11_9BACT|nr:exodeoxyribonuclease VII large subunit [Pontiella agarivorans]MDZ8118276.1 exodeoxyribonuclease VII large subunit [Pontiella agarivorans]
MAEKRQIYSVSDINRKARMVLESAMGELWVEGELSRVTIHSSGHWYFTLKDAGAAVSCAMFARDNAGVAFRPKDGMQVQMLARPSLYEASGRYQLIASEMEEAGKGNLQEQFEKLKAKLDAEGLFSRDRKKPLPLLPKKIGVVTSPTGAAIRDIINVLTRRFPNIEILLAPVTVQGPAAAKSIANAINYLNKRNVKQPIDVLIVGRGGGSIEDLWAFNEEVVARAIAESEIPVISAVGHEIDFTIADFTADVRAPTPSAAAELAVREKGDLEDEVSLYQRRLNESLVRMQRDFQLRLNRAAHSYVFREPAVLVKQYRQKILSLEMRMGDLLKLESQTIFQRLERSSTRMEYLLESGVLQAHQRVDELSLLMRHEMERKAERSRQRFQSLESQLRMLNPMAVLGRGYSLTRRPDGSVVRSAEDVKKGDALITALADGKVVSKVTEKE